MPVKVLEFFEIAAVEKFIEMHKNHMKVFAFDAKPDKYWLIVDLETTEQPEPPQSTGTVLYSVGGSCLQRGKI
jgi:hypothetical protein